MLKWTLQKSLLNESENSKNSTLYKTPIKQNLDRRKVLKRRHTIDNKENIITSTPLRKIPQNFLNSPTTTFISSTSSTSPLKDILNLTPDNIKISQSTSSSLSSKHSTSTTQYALTLPKFEEEYSPSTVIPSGHILAIRGLLPDKYLENPRYLENLVSESNTPQPKRRRLSDTCFHNENENICMHQETTLSSSKMGDSTLNRLIDSILDSGRKSKKRRTRNSLNLRRRTILKNFKQTEILSPSYTPADDPASDLSFSEMSSMKKAFSKTSTTNKNSDNIKNSETLIKKKDYNYFEIGLELPSIYV